MNRIKNLISPAKYLSLSNMINAGIGAVLGLLNARLLGPELLGVIAVITGVNVTVVNFIDIRLMDVLGKLYYDVNPHSEFDTQAYQSGVIQIFIIGSAFFAVLIFGVGILATSLTIRLFTDTFVEPTWILISSSVVAGNYWLSAFSYQQRFSERFYLIGTWKVIIFFIASSTYISILFRQPNLDGYYLASLVNVSINAVAMIGLSYFIWHKYQGFTVRPRQLRLILGDYFSEFRLIFMGNILGYMKMLHRSSDILVVGYFADNRITGLYKVARSLTDMIYVLYDALNQVYYPRFMQLISKKSFVEYRKLARNMILNSGLLVASIIVLELAGLSFVVKYLLTSRFNGAEAAIVTLTIPAFFVLGFYIWFWPVFVSSGRLGQFTILNLIACGIQYLVIFLGFRFLPPTSFIPAAGYLAYYLFLVPTALFLVYSRNPKVVPDLLRGDRIN